MMHVEVKRGNHKTPTVLFPTSRKVLGIHLLLLGAFFLRTLHLTQQSLWPDEGYSLAASQWGLFKLWKEIVADHVPLYPLVLGQWREFAGSSEFSLRYLSVIFSMPSVPLAVALGRRLINQMAGYMAGFLIALSPFHLYYAQEVRMYSLLGTLALFSSWVFLRWIAHPSRVVLALQGFLYGVLAYTHYAGLFVPATHMTIALISWVFKRFGKRHLSDEQSVVLTASGRWLLSWGCAGVLFTPWILTNLGLMAKNIAGGTSQSILQIVAATLIELAFGHHVFAHLDASDPTDVTVLRSLTLLSLLFPVCFVLAMLPRRATGQPTPPLSRLVVMAHALVPYGLLILLVQATREFTPRYGFPAAPWFSIAATAGLWRLPKSLRLAGLVLLTSYHLWGTVLYFGHPGLARLDFRTATIFIVDQLEPNDVVLITAPYVVPTVDYYREMIGAEIQVAPIPPTLPMNQQETWSIIRDVLRSRNRVWYLKWQDYFSDPDGYINRWLEKSSFLVISQEIGARYSGGLRLDLWLTGPPIVDSVPVTAIPMQASINESVELVGYDAREIWPNVLTIDLYWMIRESMTVDYTVFLHLLDGRGRRVAQGDAQPYDGRFPTTRWPVGTIIKDTHQIRLDPCIPAGGYQLDVGLYDLKTMQRLGPPESNTVHIPLHLERPPLPVTRGRILSLLPEALQLRHRLPYGLGASC